MWSDTKMALHVNQFEKARVFLKGFRSKFLSNFDFAVFDKEFLINHLDICILTIDHRFESIVYHFSIIVIRVLYNTQIILVISSNFDKQFVQ